MECTAEDCGRATSTYLCGTCVSDLQAWIDDAIIYRKELDVNIARQDVGAKTEGGGGGKAGSKEPCNLDAIELKANLNTIQHNAHHYAKDPNAAGYAWLIQDWVTKAKTIVDGPTPATPRNPNEIKTKLETEIPGPLRTHALAQWLKEAKGIHITTIRLRKWAERGHITRTNTTGRPTYDPATVLTHIEHSARN